MRKWIAAGLLVSSFIFSAPAFAFYDDVHYALNYYIARVIGYTPEQAFRLANACVSVDYSFSSEPTQITNGVLDLGINNILAAQTLPIIGMVNGAGHKFMGSGDEWEKATDEVPAALEELLKHDEFKDTFRAQWRFHAFRDTYRFPDSKVDGPPYSSPRLEASATAADEAIVAQRNVLLKESYEIINLGIFLHFFQDEVPHHGYAIGGGHWVLLPNQWEQSARWEQGANGAAIEEWKKWSEWYDYDKRGSIPAGSTSDWLSYRSLASNQKLIRETADYMIQFMEKASKGKQKPLVTTGEEVAELMTPLLSELRTANKAPLRLRSMQEVISTKLLQAGMQGIPGADAGSSHKHNEEHFGKHARGPNIAEAIQIMNASLKGRNIENIPPISEPPDPAKLFHVVESSTTTGAVIEELNESVMYGELTLKIDDPEIVKKTNDKPHKLEVTLFTVPKQKDEKPYKLLEDSSTLFGIESFAGKEVLFTFVDLPIGELNVQVRYLDDAGAEMRKIEQKATLKKKLNDEVIQEGKKPAYPTDPMVAALKSAGFKITGNLLPDENGEGMEVNGAKGGETSRGLSDYVTSVKVEDKGSMEEAQKSYQSTEDWDYKRHLIEKISMGSGKAVVFINTKDSSSYGHQVAYPIAKAEAHFLCGKVLTHIWHDLEAKNSYDFTKVTGVEWNKLSDQADKDGQALWPQAMAELKGHLTDVAGALQSKGVCDGNVNSKAPVSPSDSGIEASADQAPSEEASNEQEMKPEGVQGLNAAVSPVTAAAPRTNDWTQNRLWAKGQPAEALSASISKQITDFYQSPQVSDTAARELFADVSSHIARRQLPSSAFSGDTSVNTPRQVQLAWAQNQQRAILQNNLKWKSTQALAALSKEGQETLYSDIAQSLALRFQNGAAPQASVPFLPPAAPAPLFPVDNSGEAAAIPGQVPLFQNPNTNSGPGVPPSIADMIQRFAANNAPPAALVPAETTQIVHQEYEPGIDRPGSDYRSFDMEASAVPRQCQSECQREWPQCKAWTYVNAGVQGPTPRCWLKTAVPAGVAHSGTTSGVMPQAQ